MPDAERLTRRWLTDCVLALNLCPFAAPVLQGDGLRIALSPALEAEACLQDFLLELDRIQATTESEVATTLLVFERGLADFDEFLDVLSMAQDLLRQAGLEDLLQIASFHPEYLFEAEDTRSLSHYTNRSPYPTLHLLRQDMMARLLQEFPGSETIPARNIATLEALGSAGVAKLWRPLGLSGPD